MSDDELDPSARAALARARREVAPPSRLEEQIVTGLRQRGLIHRRRRHLGIILTIAAAAVLVIAATIPLWRDRVRPAPVPGPRFALLLYDGPQDAGLAPGARRPEFQAWVRDLVRRGVTVTGAELTGESQSLPGSPAVPADAVPGGFFIVSAASEAAAADLASSCPQLRRGGRIVIRRIAG